MGNHKIAFTFILQLTPHALKRFYAVVFLLSIFISCADDPKEEKETTDSLSFASKSIEKSLDNCSPEEGECTFISLNFPVAKGADQAENINYRIQQFLNNTIDYQEENDTKNPEVLAENFINNYKETAQEFPEYELPWEATISGKIIHTSPELIAIQFKTDMFTGGAHGYQSTNFLNFNPETGKNYTNADLFKNEFTEFVEKDFRQKQNIPANSNINSTGMFFENDSFHLPQNIGITNNEVILYYNAYEIAPYASGNFVLTYPRSEINRFLKIAGKDKETKM